MIKPKNRHVNRAQYIILGGALAAVAYEGILFFIHRPSVFGGQGIAWILAAAWILVLVVLTSFVIAEWEEKSDPEKVELTDEALDEIVEKIDSHASIDDLDESNSKRNELTGPSGITVSIDERIDEILTEGCPTCEVAPDGVTIRTPDSISVQPCGHSVFAESGDLVEGERE